MCSSKEFVIKTCNRKIVTITHVILTVSDSPNTTAQHFFLSFTSCFLWDCVHVHFGVGLGAVCGKWVSQSLSMATQKGLKAHVCFCVCERGTSPKMYEVGSGFLINISVCLL